MLYETLAQPMLLINFLLAGLLGGLIFDIANFLKFLCNNKKFACVLFDVLATSLCLIILFFVNLKLNYGLIRLFPAVIFLLSFGVERFTLGKIVAKIYLSCYNLLEKFKQRIMRKKDETNQNG